MLTKTDRAELCSRVNLLDILQADGVEVRRNGKAYQAKIREERTASCHVYPPGVGRRGSDGWTLHDYGDGWGGDALAYLVDIRGLDYAAAVAEMIQLSGWTPPSWKTGSGGLPVTSKRPAPRPKALPKTPDLPRLSDEAQTAAADALILALAELFPDACRKGDDYLAGRGCLIPGSPAWLIEKGELTRLSTHLAAGPDADLLRQAGILKAEGLTWWDRVCLLACFNESGEPAYFIGRRLDWSPGDKYGKYINQSTATGAKRWPYNLPALYKAAGHLNGWPWNPDPKKAGDLLLVEGPLDALAAGTLGWPGIALLSRPQAYDYKADAGAAVDMLTPHLSALLDMPRVLVIPDADPGGKGDEGEALAARLAAWLKVRGVRADTMRLKDINAPAACKDLAEWAELEKTSSGKKSPACPPLEDNNGHRPQPAARLKGR